MKPAIGFWPRFVLHNLVWMLTLGFSSLEIEWAARQGYWLAGVTFLWVMLALDWRKTSTVDSRL